MEYTCTHNHQSQFIEWFGNSEMIELGNVATFINGSAFKPEEWASDGLPIIRIQNLTDPSASYNYYSGTDAKVIIESGDVLVSWSATLDVYLWNQGEAVLNQHIFKVVFDKIGIDKDFFVYTVKSKLAEMVSKAHGSTMKHIVKKDFETTLVPYPSFEKQKEFAEIVCQSDKSKFDGFKSQFIEMFGNPITGWKYPVTTLGDCFKIGTGGTPSRENSSFYDGIIPWVKSTEVNYNYINDTEEHLSKNGVDSSNCKLYPVGTVLMAMYGQGSTRGRVAVLEVPATVNQAIAAIQIYDEDESAFVFNILTILYSHIRDMAIGGNQKNLNLKLVSQIPYIKVPSQKRKEFAAIVRQADKSKYYKLN